MDRKQLLIEADELMTDAFNCESKHCQDCKHFLVVRDAFGTGDSPSENYCECNDPYDCLAVESVYAEMDNLSEDELLNSEAVESVSQDIANYADANNTEALLRVVKESLRYHRFEQAKDELI